MDLQNLRAIKSDIIHVHLRALDVDPGKLAPVGGFWDGDDDG